ncbi:hypothetical protein FHS21_004806 [Phyllobacterium trifolii]|uniref:Uncharacterized protein n=1 Tax=Phyllobacterium trifolii TaxID=300193 RepID=A0A839UIJ3_9HYPH|nr:hypothetical protein [Phyllobacterium trifolii]
MNKRLDHRLECPKCGTIYLRIPGEVQAHTFNVAHVTEC